MWIRQSLEHNWLPTVWVRQPYIQIFGYLALKMKIHGEKKNFDELKNDSWTFRHGGDNCC